MICLLSEEPIRKSHFHLLIRFMDRDQNRFISFEFKFRTPREFRLRIFRNKNARDK